jgi:CRP/FNR family transcriptional regulator, cyclic AMP receptor protein
MSWLSHCQDGAVTRRGNGPIDVLHGLEYEHHMAASPLESLASIPLFANLSGRQLRRILKSTVEDRYESGDVIVSEGGHTQTLFIVLEGTAKAVRGGRTVSRHSPGEFFGEISMIDGRPRAASVVAETPMRCLVMYHDALRKIVISEPQVAWALLQSLAGRIRDD